MKIHLIGNEEVSFKLKEVVSRLDFTLKTYPSLTDYTNVDRSPGVVLASQNESSIALASREVSEPLVVYADSPSAQEVVQALRRGAIDYIDTPFEDQKVEKILSSALEVARTSDEEAREYADAMEKLKSLTERERDVLKGVTWGGSNKSIAKDLGISPRTVEIYRGNLMKKIEARSAAAVVRFGLLVDAM